MTLWEYFSYQTYYELLWGGIGVAFVGLLWIARRIARKALLLPFIAVAIVVGAGRLRELSLIDRRLQLANSFGSSHS